MAWQDRFRALADELTAGKITVDEYRERSEEILTEAERESGRDAETTAPTRVHIPASAAVEAPSGEMTQIVGARDDTTPVTNQISEKLDSADVDG